MERSVKTVSRTELERVVYFLNDLLGIPDFPDYPNALNGLQVENGGVVSSVAAAVDATDASISAARRAGADLLVVHHGLFWAGLQPLTGANFRRISGLLQGGVALYSAHLPLDAHPDLGNCARLARSVGVDVEGPFGAYRGVEVGWWGKVTITRDALRAVLSERVGGEARLIPGGPETVRTVAVVTGGGASFVSDAAAARIDALITGEAPHHAYHEAMELGVNLYLGGHYATECAGVKALAARLEREFGLPWTFLDLPTGL